MTVRPESWSRRFNPNLEEVADLKDRYRRGAVGLVGDALADGWRIGCGSMG